MTNMCDGNTYTPSLFYMKCMHFLCIVFTVLLGFTASSSTLEEVENQLDYKFHDSWKGTSYTKKELKPSEYKTILFYKDKQPTSEGFYHKNDSICFFTNDDKYLPQADLVVFRIRGFAHNRPFSGPNSERLPGQKWAVRLQECPLNTVSFKGTASRIDWAITYRLSSTVVFRPGFVRRKTDSEVQAYMRRHPTSGRNYAQGRDKQVFWLVSDCSPNNMRGEYAEELSKYIGVDIYGKCGNLTCPRKSNCFSTLAKKYKFYLAFENSNCREYITEKLYINSYRSNVLPVVMGAHPRDYERLAAPHSYVHVDDYASPRHLAHYLHQLDQDDDKYNQYFRWHATHHVVTWPPRDYVDYRLCELLHAPESEADGQSYREDFYRWWEEEQCVVPTPDNLYASWIVHEQRNPREP